MIELTRLDGSPLGLNHVQIERVDTGPHTVVVMVNGNRYLVTETLEDIVDRVVAVEARSRRPERLRARRDPGAAGATGPSIGLVPVPDEQEA